MTVLLWHNLTKLHTLEEIIVRDYIIFWKRFLKRNYSLDLVKKWPGMVKAKSWFISTEHWHSKDDSGTITGLTLKTVLTASLKATSKRMLFKTWIGKEGTDNTTSNTCCMPTPWPRQKGTTVQESKAEQLGPQAERMTIANQPQYISKEWHTQSMVEKSGVLMRPWCSTKKLSQVIFDYT